VHGTSRREEAFDQAVVTYLVSKHIVHTRATHADEWDYNSFTTYADCKVHREERGSGGGGLGMCGERGAQGGEDHAQ
jgi:hypothetical protein